MCYTAVPGQNPGIRAVIFVSSPILSMQSTVPTVIRRIAPLTSSPVFRRGHQGTVCVFSGERDPIGSGHGHIRGYVRRDSYWWDSRRGKARRKCTHKPCWRGYEKY
jgi:hypothetical protein